MTENEYSEEILENHLHQQYAENDNNRIGVFTSFIVGIIALFGFYGYVFVNTNSREYWNFNLQEYLLMTFITIGILFSSFAIMTNSSSDNVVFISSTEQHFLHLSIIPPNGTICSKKSGL